MPLLLPTPTTSRFDRHRTEQKLIVAVNPTQTNERRHAQFRPLTAPSPTTIHQIPPTRFNFQLDGDQHADGSMLNSRPAVYECEKPELIVVADEARRNVLRAQVVKVERERAKGGKENKRTSGWRRDGGARSANIWTEGAALEATTYFVTLTATDTSPPLLPILQCPPMRYHTVLSHRRERQQ